MDVCFADEPVDPFCCGVGFDGDVRIACRFFQQLFRRIHSGNDAAERRELAKHVTDQVERRRFILLDRQFRMVEEHAGLSFFRGDGVAL